MFYATEIKEKPGTCKNCKVFVTLRRFMQQINGKFDTCENPKVFSNLKMFYATSRAIDISTNLTIVLK